MKLGIGGLLLYLFKVVQKLAREGDFWGRMFIPIIGAYLSTCLTYEILYPVWAMENFFFFSMLVTGVVLSAYNAEKPKFPVKKVDA